MAEYITKEQIIDWFSPYGHLDKPIPFETLVSDLRGIKASDVEPVKRGRWKLIGADKRGRGGVWECAGRDGCGKIYPYKCDFCPNCGARMDEEGTHER